MKDGLINRKREDAQRGSSMQTISHSVIQTEKAVLARGSDMRKSLLNQIIKLSFLLIMISPQRIINVMSLDNQLFSLWL